MKKIPTQLLCNMKRKWPDKILLDPPDYYQYMFHKASINEGGYLVIVLEGKQQLLHRLLIEGDPPAVDHINLNKLDNRRANLRSCTFAQNSANRGKQTCNTSGYKGVSWHKNRKKWVAHIGYGGKSRHLGCFDTAELAHEAYKKAATRQHGEFARFE